MSHWPERARARIVLSSALLGAMLPMALTATPVAAALNTKVTLYLGDCAFKGGGAGANKTVDVLWRDDLGVAKSHQVVTSNAAGKWSIACDPDQLIEGGDEIRTTVGSAQKTIHVPDLSVSVDRDTDLVSVYGPASTELKIEADTYNGGFAARTPHVLKRTTDGDGAASANFAAASVNIRGWDDVYVTLKNANGTFNRHVYAQAVSIMLDRPWMSIAGNPGSNVDVSLSTVAADVHDAGGYLDYYGVLNTTFIDGRGRNVRFRSGDELTSTTVAADFGFHVFDIVWSANRTADTVTGSCNNGDVGVKVMLHSPDYSTVVSRTATADALGHFSVSFKTGSPTWNIVRGDHVNVFCKLESGDIEWTEGQV